MHSKRISVQSNKGIQVFYYPCFRKFVDKPFRLELDGDLFYTIAISIKRTTIGSGSCVLIEFGRNAGGIEIGCIFAEARRRQKMCIQLAIVERQWFIHFFAVETMREIEAGIKWTINCYVICFANQVFIAQFTANDTGTLSFFFMKYFTKIIVQRCSRLDVAMIYHN